MLAVFGHAAFAGADVEREMNRIRGEQPVGFFDEGLHSVVLSRVSGSLDRFEQGCGDLKYLV